MSPINGKNWSLFSFLISCLIGWLTAGCAAEISGGTEPANPQTTATIEVLFPAMVEAIKIKATDEVPIEVSVQVRGTLPSVCSAIDTITQEQSGNSIYLQIMARRQTDVNCEESAISFEENVSLNVGGLPAGIYVADVNGLKGTFIIEQDNVVDPENAVVGGRIWQDMCILSGSEGSEPIDPGRCRSQGLDTWRANGQAETEEPGIAMVIVDLGNGQCPSKGLATTISDSEGLYFFSGLKAGTYCVSIDERARLNQDSLSTGAWTTVSEVAPGNTAVTLDRSQSNLDVNFGWEFVDEPVITETPTSTPIGCTDVAAFMGDVTIPDDTIIEPGTTFTKTWEFKNVGTCIWTTDYLMVFVEGEEFGAVRRQPIGVFVNPGEVAELSLELTASEGMEPGIYRGSWKLENTKGIQFGIGSNANQPFWVQIRIEE